MNQIQTYVTLPRLAGRLGLRALPGGILGAARDLSAGRHGAGRLETEDVDGDRRPRRSSGGTGHIWNSTGDAGSMIHPPPEGRADGSDHDTIQGLQVPQPTGGTLGGVPQPLRYRVAVRRRGVQVQGRDVLPSPTSGCPTRTLGWRSNGKGCWATTGSWSIPPTLARESGRRVITVSGDPKSHKALDLVRGAEARRGEVRPCDVGDKMILAVFSAGGSHNDLSETFPTTSQRWRHGRCVSSSPTASGKHRPRARDVKRASPGRIPGLAALQSPFEAFRSPQRNVTKHYEYCSETTREKSSRRRPDSRRAGDAGRHRGQVKEEDGKRDTLSWPPETQRKLMGVIVTQPRTSALLCDDMEFKPDWFTDEAHRMIAKTVLGFRQDYKRHPDLSEIRHELGKLPQDKQERRQRELAQLAMCEQYDVEAQCESQSLDYWTSQLRDFCANRAFKEVAFDVLTTGKRPDWRKTIARMDRIANAGTARATWDEIDDFLDRATAKKALWLIRDLLPLGQMLLLSGHEKAGKSVLLYALVSCLLTGREWLGNAVGRAAPSWS